MRQQAVSSPGETRHAANGIDPTGIAGTAGMRTDPPQYIFGCRPRFGGARLPRSTDPVRFRDAFRRVHRRLHAALCALPAHQWRDRRDRLTTGRGRAAFSGELPEYSRRDRNQGHHRHPSLRGIASPKSASSSSTTVTSCRAFSATWCRSSSATISTGCASRAPTGSGHCSLVSVFTGCRSPGRTRRGSGTPADRWGRYYDFTPSSSSASWTTPGGAGAPKLRLSRRLPDHVRDHHCIAYAGAGNARPDGAQRRPRRTQLRGTHAAGRPACRVLAGTVVAGSRGSWPITVSTGLSRTSQPF